MSQVLEFPSAKRYLFKQLTVTKVTHIGTLKLPLNRSCLFGDERLIEGALILPHKDFENRAPYKKNLFKVLELSMRELRVLKLYSHEELFLYYGF